MEAIPAADVMTGEEGGAEALGDIVNDMDDGAGEEDGGEPKPVASVAEAIADAAAAEPEESEEPPPAETDDADDAETC